MDNLEKKRAIEGYYAQAGACNPGALIRSLKEMMDDDPSLRFDKLKDDPGVRMVVHQLAFLIFDVEPENSTYSQDYWICNEAYKNQ